MARPRVINEQALLQAARDVFVARGAEATTREVAEAAGISQAVLFQRYRSKKRLYFAAMLPRPPDLAELIGEAPPPGAAEARLYLGQLAARLFAWLADTMPGALRAAFHPDFRTAVPDAHAPHGAQPISAAIADRFALMQQQGSMTGKVDPDKAARLFVELLHGQALAALLASDGRRDPRTAGLEILWRGLRP